LVGFSLVLLAAVFPGLKVGAATPNFQGVGRVRASDSTEAWDVSDDGSVVAGYSATGTNGVAFRWTAAGGIESLGRVAGRSGGTAARAVSADGTTVVGDGNTGANTVPEAFRWTRSGGAVGLGTFGGHATDLSIAEGVSADGSVVVGLSTGGGRIEAFRWSGPTGLVGLGTLPGAPTQWSSATDITRDGSVIVGTSDSLTGHRAVRWTSIGIEAIDQLSGAVGSYAYAVSGDGSVVVGSVIAAEGELPSAFRWTEGAGMKLLRQGPAGDKEYSTDVSADGSIVVGRADFGAFIWDPIHGMRNLRTVLESDYGLTEQLRGWRLGMAYAISADGTAIVGSGSNPQGREEGFIAIIPEPSALAVASVGALLLLPRRRHVVCPHVTVYRPREGI
jgi:probable HAF family extracellular repeat protein